MGKKVYANSKEISSKKSGVKAIASPSDVNHTPPPPPPMVAAKIGIPLPYPNFGKQSSLLKGTKSVLIKGQPISRKNLSYYKKSSGNEPATSQFKKGVVSHEIKAKTYAATYSMDVFVEKKNVVRNTDTSKHNAGSGEINTTIGKFTGDIATDAGREDACKQANDANETERARQAEKENIPDYASNTVATFTDGNTIRTTFSGLSDLKNTDHLVKPVAMDERQGGIELCDGIKHKSVIEKPTKPGEKAKDYTTSNNIAACHCETKLIPDFIRNGSGIQNKTLVGNIDWKKKDLTKLGKSLNRLKRLNGPCKDCFRLLCETADSCKATIFLCNEQGKPVNIDKSCNVAKKKPAAGLKLLTKALN